MKKIAISIVLVTMASLAVFAAGSAEDTGTMPWAQGRGQYQSGVVISEDITKVTGILKLVENGHRELVAGDETYELMYPYRLTYVTDLKDGMEITVEGFEAENMRFDNNEATKNLMVQSATIDGQTYDIAESMENYYGGYRRMGRAGKKGGYMTSNSQFQGPMGSNGANGNFNSNRGNGYNNMPMGRGGRSGHMGGNFASGGGSSQNNFFGWNRR